MSLAGSIAERFLWLGSLVFGSVLFMGFNFYLMMASLAKHIRRL